ncbi:hypothetical protein PPACK8108_LOCUS25758 [Phakopsora pachyrhizi]|uniref:Secreted protein n=1 Tax=Phakopsora pachyrhizi TaxID=170000 RepID=A0AAV0BSJ8_PHAPC|nr:hypothetical protein PPACK8108_LOCUS25758 [Phakopsora pachyrhizi]
MAHLTLVAILCISIVINTSAYIEDITSPFFKVEEGGRSEHLTTGCSQYPPFFSTDTPLELLKSQAGTSSYKSSIGTDTYRPMNNKIVGLSEKNWYPLNSQSGSSVFQNGKFVDDTRLSHYSEVSSIIQENLVSKQSDHLKK